MTEFIECTKVSDIIDSLQGQMVSVTFIKMNGSSRKLTGQLVASPESHTGRSDLFTIALASSKKDSKQFRSASRSKITRIAAKGEVLFASEGEV